MRTIAKRRSFRPTARQKPPALAAMGLFVLGCAATPSGATPVDLARGRSTTAQGAEVFANECARCHGPRGEGLAGAPSVLGPGALPLYPRDNASAGSFAMSDPEQLQIQQQTRPAGAPWRDPFRNAESFYGFVSNHLPRSRASALKPNDYWAVVTFMLSVQGSNLPSEGVTASNAGSITIPGQ
jgi:mono/diheme cytochrome c family protein